MLISNWIYSVHSTVKDIKLNVETNKLYEVLVYLYVHLESGSVDYRSYTFLPHFFSAAIIITSLSTDQLKIHFL